MKLSVDLSAAQLKKILIKMSAKKYGVDPNEIEVSFNVVEGSDYYDRPTGPEFNGASITIETEEEFDLE